MKYLIKNTTAKTVWKKVLIKELDSKKSTFSGKTPTSTLLSTKLNGVKLCTWSRNFDWEPFRISFPQHTDDY